MSAAKLYESRGCDELILLDIDATPNRRAPRFEEIKQFTSQLYCPLAIGGGIRTIGDINRMLNSGADKVIINTHAHPHFIEEAAFKFGSQCITVAIDYEASSYIDSIVDIAALMEDSGAGEIILTNKGLDGVKGGYDLPTIKAVSYAVKIPVIANGGCNSPQDMLLAINSGAHAVAASSMFLYNNVTIQQCKSYLDKYGIPVRIETDGESTKR
jgi:cyclase